MNLADEISKQAQARPEKLAVRTADETLDYAQLDTLVRKAAGALRERGVLPGDVLAFSLDNPLATLVFLLATARIGATAFSFRKALPPAVRAEMAQKVAAKYELCDRANGDAMDGLPRLVIDLEQIGNSAARYPEDRRVASPAAPWLIVAGSGSTGRKKYFSITQDQFFARTQLGGEMIALNPSDTLASLSPIDFTGPKDRYLGALFCGATIALCDWPQPNPIAALSRLGVTVLHATVFHLEKLLATLPADARHQLDFLRVLLVGASTVSEGLRQRIANMLTPNLYVRYATNEAGPLTISRPHEALHTPGTVGRPPPGVRIELVDPAGYPVAAGTAGHIRVRSPALTDTYIDDAGTGQEAFRDGWFHPGDLGRFTPDGELIFCGRADHMMIANGINIYPAEIERVVSTHPAVRDMAAVPLRSSVHQDVPVCAVVPDRAAPVTEDGILAFLRPRLGPATPRRIFLLDRIPRNEQGKLQRPELYAEIERRLKAPALANPTRPADWLAEPFRSRQALQPMHMHCRIPLNADIEAIDAWLDRVLEVPLDAVPCPDFSAQAPALKTMAMLTQRALLLFRALLQAARFPVFDPGRVIGVQPGKTATDGWIALCAVARIEQVSSRATLLAREGALRALRWMADRPVTPENQTALTASLEREVVAPLRKLSPRGKSTYPVLRAAHAADIPFQHLGAGVFQLGWGAQARLLDRSTVREDSAIGARLAQNKAWTGQLLRQAGLPIPRQQIVGNEKQARHAARTIGWPVVVKPVDCDRGEGVTVGIADLNALSDALKPALQASRAKQALVEAEARGVCHRLFIARGRLLYAVKRLPKSVHGDGQSTVVELIRQANLDEQRHPPWSRAEPYPDDDLALSAIRAAGHTLESIPAAAERIPLRPIESTAWGGFDEDVTRHIHPDNLDIALRAAVLFGLEVAGIDIISTDIGIAWHQNGAVINEVNFAPLLGGAEISRSHIPEYLKRILCKDGRIPVEVVVGSDQALNQARRRQAAWVGQGVACYLSSHELTLTPTGDILPFPFVGLYPRCKALMLDRQVAALVLVVQNDQLLMTGMPLDRIDRLSLADPGLAACGTPNGRTRLIRLLKLHCEMA